MTPEASPFLPADVRALFPGVRDKTYLNVPVCGLVPQPVADAGRAHIDERMWGSGDKTEFQAAVGRARELMAALLGADAEELAITKNVSEALNLFASSLPWEAGQNVVLCPDLEHPNNVFLWYNLRKLRGIEVRTVDPDAGRNDDEYVVIDWKGPSRQKLHPECGPRRRPHERAAG